MRKFHSRRKAGKAAPVLIAVAAVIAVMAGYQVWKAVKPAEGAGPVVTVAQTAGTTDEVDIVWPGEVTELLAASADNNGTLQWVRAQGVATETVSIDLTPRTSKGDEVKPVKLRTRRIMEAQAEFLAQMNAFDATGARSTLAALQGVAPGQGPVLVVASGLDTVAPLEFAVLGFDASIDEVVAALEAANELPKHLGGREVWLVFTPTAGEQDPLRAPDKEYRAKLYAAVVAAAGGEVTRVLESGAAPAGTGGTAPTVSVPPPPGTFVPEPEMVPSPVDPRDPTAPPKVVQKCVLPAGVLFHGDADTLLDEGSALAMVKTCLGDNPVEHVELIGHTAKTSPDSAPDNPVAMDLSTRRAEVIAGLVVDDLGIDAAKVIARGVGATEPLTQPDSDPGNRAVEVRVIYTSA